MHAGTPSFPSFHLLKSNILGFISIEVPSLIDIDCLNHIDAFSINLCLCMFLNEVPVSVSISDDQKKAVMEENLIPGPHGRTPAMYEVDKGHKTESYIVAIRGNKMPPQDNKPVYYKKPVSTFSVF